MTHEFTVEDWQTTGDTFSMHLNIKNPIEKPLIQIYRYPTPDVTTVGTLIIPMMVSFIQGNNSILIQSRDTFAGYIVIR